MTTVWRGKEARMDKCLIAFAHLAKERKFPPSLNEIAEEMGVAYATAHLACADLIEAGLMVREVPNQARSLCLTGDGKRRLPRARSRKTRANGGRAA